MTMGFSTRSWSQMTCDASITIEELYDNGCTKKFKLRVELGTHKFLNGMMVELSSIYIDFGTVVLKPEASNIGFSFNSGNGEINFFNLTPVDLEDPLENYLVLFDVHGQPDMCVDDFLNDFRTFLTPDLCLMI